MYRTTPRRDLLAAVSAVPWPTRQARAGRLAVSFAVLMGIAVAGVAPALQARAAAPPVLKVSAPHHVAAGQPIVIDVTIRNASTLGAFEATLSYDTTKAHLSGLEDRARELVKQHRGIGILGPLEHAAGASFGFYSCVGTSCATRTRKGRTAGPADVTVAQLLVTPDARGHLELRLVSKAVDRNGQTMALAGASQRFVVDVGSGARSFPAPKAPALAGTRAPATALRSLDLTGDDVTSNADAVEVALTWQTTRQHGGSCNVAVGDPADINGDGCVDVADIQSITGHYSSAKRLPRGLRGAPVPTAGLPTATWTVNSTSDTADANPGNGVCATSGGTCTLRAAIQEANAHPGPDTIQFNISGSGVKTIQLSSMLPTLNDESGLTTIDGYTQPGATVNTSPLAFNANILIEVRGGGEGAFVGLVITSAFNTVRGISIYRLPIHIEITGTGAHDNNLVGDIIGTNASATYLAPSRIERSGAAHLDNSAHDNYVGRPNLVDRNVISGSSSEAIYLTGAVHNYFYNNIDGLSPDGSRRVTNRIHGIDLNFGSAHNIVGGLGPLEHNVFSGNLRSGIESSHGRNTIDNQLIGNYIGTTLTGTSSPSYAGNDSFGIHMEDGSSENLAMGNVVGNSDEGGIVVEGYYAYDNRIVDNRVGISLDGTAIPNSVAGVRVTFHGGRSIIGPGNIIANNPAGIVIDAADTLSNRITQNSIFDNGGLGIEIAPNGPNPNDPGDTDVGPNGRLNYPVLVLATPDQIRGTACAGCAIEAFIADPNAGDLGGGNYGQPRTYLGTATAGADGWFTIDPGAVAVGQLVTAVATDAASSSSESSRNLAVTAAPPTGTFASDAFGRSVTDAWGSADFGGAWTLAGAASAFDVTGGAGTMTLPNANGSRAATLFGVTAHDVDLTVRVHTDVVGDNAHIYLIGRRSATLVTEYRARLRLGTTGKVYLAATRVENSTETQIGSEVLVAGLSHAPGQDLRLRAQMAGAYPTRIQIRAWRDGQPEPATWTLVVTDGTPALQGNGAVGVRAYLGAGATNAPMTISFDDLAVTQAPAPPPPDPTPTPTPAPPIAKDSFTRTQANGWGSAETGGAYTVGGGPASDFRVDGAAGVAVLTSPGAFRVATLNAVNVVDAQASVAIAADSVADGGHLYVVLRRKVETDGLREYRARLRIASGGTMYLELTRVSAGVETALGPELLVSGTQAPGQSIHVRASASGSGTTTIRARAWLDGTTEPTTWLVTAADATGTLQAAGAVGLRAYLGSTAAAPLTLHFDDLEVIVPPTP